MIDRAGAGPALANTPAGTPSGERCLFWAALLSFLNASDVVLTLTGVVLLGASEGNPFMAGLLRWPWAFVAFKFLVVPIGAEFLEAARALKLLQACVAIYACIVAWNCCMIGLALFF